jgi:hypothetical protein
MCILLYIVIDNMICARKLNLVDTKITYIMQVSGLKFQIFYLFIFKVKFLATKLLNNNKKTPWFVFSIHMSYLTTVHALIYYMLICD